MKVQVPAHPISGACEIDTVDLADRLNDIARRLDVAMLAVEGAEAIGGTDDLGPVAEFIREVRGQVRAVSDDIHHAPPRSDDDAGGEEGEAMS